MVDGSMFSRGSAEVMGGTFFAPRLHLMPNLFDYFYRVTWDLIAAPRKARKGKKGNYSIVVSSCGRGEGASTIALNLASAFANNSLKSAVLIDGNLRDPSLHHHFTRTRRYGLSELILGEMEIEEAVTEISENRLYFIPAGSETQNPILLYEAPEFVSLMERLRNTYDLIIFDSSPVMRYPETPILASNMDGLIMVLEAEGTRWEVADAAKQNLETAGVNILGAILNKREFFIPRSVYRLL